MVHYCTEPFTTTRPHFASLKERCLRQFQYVNPLPPTNFHKLIVLSTGPKSLPHELDFLVWTGLLSDFAERSSYVVRPEEEAMFRDAIQERPSSHPRFNAHL